MKLTMTKAFDHLWALTLRRVEWDNGQRSIRLRMGCMLIVVGDVCYLMGPKFDIFKDDIVEQAIDQCDEPYKLLNFYSSREDY